MVTKSDVRKDPNKFFTHAIRCLEEQDYKKAIEIFFIIHKDLPKNIQIINLLAYCFLETKNLADAKKKYLTSLSLDSNQAEVLFNLGVIFEEEREFNKAENFYKKVIDIDNNINAFINLANVLDKNKKQDEALQILNEAIKIHGNDKKIIFNKAEILKSNGLLEDALNLYLTLEEQGLGTESLFINKGNTYKSLSRFDDAEKAYRKAIDINDSDNAKFHLGLLYLQQKKFEQGWKLYDFRPNIKDKINSYNRIKLLNQIEPMGNILIWCEQGIGTHIIFLPLLKDLVDLNQNITLMVDKRLFNLIKNYIPKIKLIDIKKEIDQDKFTYHLPIASLGNFFRKEINSFKVKVFPIFKNDKDKLLSFKKKYFNLTKKSFVKKIFNSQKKVIGVSWKSSSEITGDRKSLNLRDLKNILDQYPNDIIVNLQYGNVEKELVEYNKDSKNKIIFIDDLDIFNDLDSFGLLVDSCDFILTTSNSTAHFAGAFNIKTTLFLPKETGRIWYWQDYKGKSLWYPSIELKYFDENKKFI